MPRGVRKITFSSNQGLFRSSPLKINQATTFLSMPITTLLQRLFYLLFKIIPFALPTYIDSKGAFFKHPKFKSEQEFRIIVEMPEAKIPRQKDDPKKYVGVHNQELWEGFCTKHGLIVPFLNVSFSKEAIQRITIAPMVEYEIAKKSIRELLECQRIKNVQIYKSTIPIRF